MPRRAGAAPQPSAPRRALRRANARPGRLWLGRCEHARRDRRHPAPVFARARALGEEIATFAPLSIQASREGIRRLRVASPLPDDSDLIKLCYESADFKEGMTAFFEKRQPDWRGE